MKLLQLAVAILIPVLLAGCSGNPDEVVKNYCKALEVGKVDEAQSFLSKSAKRDLEQAGGKSLLLAAGEKFKLRKGISAIKIIRKKVTGESAMVEFIYNFNDGSTFGDSFPLIKENGTWKISR